MTVVRESLLLGVSFVREEIQLGVGSAGRCRHDTNTVLLRAFAWGGEMWNACKAVAVECVRASTLRQ